MQPTNSTVSISVIDIEDQPCVMLAIQELDRALLLTAEGAVDLAYLLMKHADTIRPAFSEE